MNSIISQFEESDIEWDKLYTENMKKIHEDVAKAEEMRKQSLETYKETKKEKCKWWPWQTHDKEKS